MTTDTRLLLVDDDPALLRAFKAALTRHGLTVDTANNGREAVDDLRSHKAPVALPTRRPHRIVPA